MNITILTLSLLSGVSVLAQTLSPSGLPFGAQAINQLSAKKTLTYKNAQTVALVIETITIEGANTGDFLWGGNCPQSPTPLAAGASCTITVQFKPTTTAKETATLVLNLGAGTTATATLSGTGIEPVTFGSNPLAFADQAEGTRSATQAETISNLQTKPLKISTIAVSGAFSYAGGTCPVGAGSVAAGATCNIFIAFSPTAVGAETGTLTITDNAANSPQTASLSGNGITPVTVSSSTLNLPSAAVGNTSAVRTVTLTNQENIPLNFTSIAASGAFAVATNSCGASVAAGATCAIGVTFSPSALGAVAGTLTITDNATNSPQTVGLAGTGIAQVTLSTGSLTYPSTTVGVTSAVQTVTLTNNMTTSLAIGGAARPAISQWPAIPVGPWLVRDFSARLE